MATASRDSLSSQQQQPLQQAVSAEDESLKRNTDCVYFLASPLTCKKGSECEYRHSEDARMNPRDCYYWLNGNCLNPKCAFRHPPLDGLLGAQVVPPSGLSLPSSQTAVPLNAMYNPGKQVAATNAPFNSGKQAVPCIFFFKGLCVKGDRCAFSHGLNHVSNKFTREPAAAAVREPPNLKKASFGGLQKCSNEQNPPLANMFKSNHEVAPNVKPVPKLDTATSKNRIVAQKSVRAPGQFNDEDSNHWEPNFSQVTNGNNNIVWSNHMHQTDVSVDQSLPNGSKDADEFYKESSPGFDVLVDDELRDSDYYHNEDQYGRSGGHEGRNLAEFDVDRFDYNRGADIDGEMFVEPLGNDSYDRKQGQHDWTQHRDDYSSDWRTSEPAPLERRRNYRNSVSPNQIEESDLRYRLSKQRRVNGLKSVISKDYPPRNYNEEWRNRDSGDSSHHLRPNLNESSLGSRLRGRISIPSRSLPTNDDNLCSDRDLVRERNFSRYSPGRPLSSSHQGRLQDRLKGRVQDDFYRRDRMSDAKKNFSGPKSLAELKVSKKGERKEKQTDDQDAFSHGKRRNHQQSDDDFSFDGPKPLSEILKRKRAEIEPERSVVNVNPSIEMESTHDESLATNVNTSAVELEEGVEDNDEPEAYDENEADLDEADYTLEEGENAYPEEEYLEEDEDGDDFAKKVGVMFS